MVEILLRLGSTGGRWILCSTEPCGIQISISFNCWSTTVPISHSVDADCVFRPVIPKSSVLLRPLEWMSFQETRSPMHSKYPKRTFIGVYHALSEDPGAETSGGSRAAASCEMETSNGSAYCSGPERIPTFGYPTSMRIGPDSDTTALEAVRSGHHAIIKKGIDFQKADLARLLIRALPQGRMDSHRYAIELRASSPNGAGRFRSDGSTSLVVRTKNQPITLDVVQKWRCGPVLRQYFRWRTGVDDGIRIGRRSTGSRRDLYKLDAIWIEAHRVGFSAPSLFTGHHRNPDEYR